MASEGFILSPGLGMRVAQVAGLTSTAFLCGKTYTQSFTAPALLLAPTPLLAEQWSAHLGKDRAVAPLGLIASSGLFAYLSYKSQTHLGALSARSLYLSAAALLFTWIPYSLCVLEPMNRKLAGKVAALRRQRRNQPTSPQSPSKNKRDFTVTSVNSPKQNEKLSITVTRILLSFWTLDLGRFFDEPVDELTMEGELEAQDFESMHLLVDQWATLNLARTAIAGVAAVVGTFAALKHGRN